MRDLYSLSSFFVAAEAWEKHKLAYLQRLAKARQPEPSHEIMLNYKQIWIEGYIESQADAETEKPETTE